MTGCGYGKLQCVTRFWKTVPNHIFVLVLTMAHEEN